MLLTEQITSNPESSADAQGIHEIGSNIASHKFASHSWLAQPDFSNCHPVTVKSLPLRLSNGLCTSPSTHPPIGVGQPHIATVRCISPNSTLCS